MTEVWKPVVGWETLYEVSDHGRVRSLDRITLTRRPCGKIVPQRFRGRILAAGNVDGYLQVVLQQAGVRTLAQRKVHQLVLEAFVGPRPKGYVARHLNGHSKDCRLGNLAWSTKEENEADKIKHGTLYRGEDHPRSKLTEKQVIAIREHFGTTGSRLGLASKYGVSYEVVYDITRRKIWRHVA